MCVCVVSYKPPLSDHTIIFFYYSVTSKPLKLLTEYLYVNILYYSLIKSLL